MFEINEFDIVLLESNLIVLVYRINNNVLMK